MTQTNLEFMQGLYAAFGRGDVPTVLGSMAPGIEWTEAENHIYADRNPYVGPQAVLEGVFMRLGSEWDGFTVTPVEFLDAGNRIVVLGIYSGTYKATAKSLRAQFVHVWTLGDGKILRFQQYTDTKQFADVVSR